MSLISGIMMGASIGSAIHDVMAGKKKTQGGAIGTGSAGSYQGRRVQGSAQARPVEVAPAPVPEFALVSSLPGRRRYRMAALVNNAPLAVLLEKKLVEFAPVNTVQVNPVTGSILITFQASAEAEVAMNNLMEKLRQRLVPVEAEGNKGKRKKLSPTTYASSWTSTGSFLNDKVRGLSRNSFDISTLLSLFFLVRGIRKMVLYGQRPAGPTMVWWALHLMKGWKG